MGPARAGGRFGPRREGRAPDAPIPVLVAGDRPVTDWVVPAASRAGDFTARNVARNPAQPNEATGDVTLTPFFRTHRRRYSVYFDVLTPPEFDAKAAGIAAQRDRAAKLEAATVGFVQPGEMQPERDYNYQSEPADRPVARTNGRTNRGGPGWFSFDMPVDATTDMALIVTYFNEVGLPPTLANFDIRIDGTSIAKFEPNRTASGFFDTQYAIPADLVKGKTKVTVKFDTGGSGRIVPVFGVRMIRAK